MSTTPWIFALAALAGCSGKAQDVLFVSHSTASVREVEPTLAISRDGQALAVAWMGQSERDRSSGLFPAYGHIGYAMSFDGGATWGEPAAIPTPGADGGITKFSIDPELDVDAAGAFHLTYGTRQTGDGQGAENVFYAHAAPGMPAFGDGFDLATMPGTDRPWIHVAPSGTILVTYLAAGGFVAATSRDGTTWKSTVIPGATSGALVLCDGSPAERVYAVELTIADQLAIALAVSDDAGASWRAPLAVSQPGERVSLDPPSCAADGDRVWIAYGLTPDDPFQLPERVFPRNDAIRVAHSADGGATITARLPAMDGAFPFSQHPRIAIAPDGAVHLAYYAGRDRGDTAGDLRRTRLARGADAFAPSVAIAAPITFDTLHSGPAFVGDFLDMTFSGTSLVVAYGDNSSGVSHITIRRLEAP